MADRPKIEFELTAVDNISAKLAAIKKSFRGIASANNAFGKTLRSTTDSVKKHTGALHNLFSAIKRIAFYRMIRSAIKAVTTAFKEGTNNLVLYSRALGNIDSAHASSTMNELATTALYVKNSLGAALMPILQALVPVINSIADAFVTATNAVNQFFHALKGETYFTKAKKYAVDYAEGLDKASGAAKELKKQIFGFDELNIFTAPSSGGGGGGSGLDYTQMFEESPISDFLNQIRKNIEEGDWDAVGALLAHKLNRIVDGIDTEKLGTNIGTKIQNAIDFAYGFVSNLKFDNAGTKLGKLFNRITESVKPEKLGRTVAGIITGAIDFGASFLKEANLGNALNNIGQAFVGLLNGLSDWIQRVDWETVGQLFYDKLKETLTGIDFDSISSSIWEFFGSALGAAFSFAKGVTFDRIFTDVDEYFSQKTEECGGNAVLGFLKGVKDGILGIDEWIYNNVVFPFMDGLLRGLGIDTGYSKETYTVGDEVVTGFFKGGKDKIDEYKNWVKETFVDPFLDKLRLNFLISGGNGASAIMQTIGQSVMQGFFLGLKGKWSSEIAPWLAKKAQALKDLFKGIFDSLKHPESKRQLDFGIPVDLYAEGGQPKAGSLFIAGEAGAELVGQVGGRTTVTTHDQFSQGMSDIMDNTNTVILQAAQALISAIQNKNMTAIVTLGDRDIVSSYDRGKRLAGASLVE